MVDAPRAEQATPPHLDRTPHKGRFHIHTPHFLHVLNAHARKILRSYYPPSKEPIVPQPISPLMQAALKASLTREPIPQNLTDETAQSAYDAMRKGFDLGTEEGRRKEYEQAMQQAEQIAQEAKPNHFDKPPSQKEPLMEGMLALAADALGKVIIPPNLLNGTSKEPQTIASILQNLAYVHEQSFVDILAQCMKNGREGYTIAQSLAQLVYNISHRHEELSDLPQLRDIPTALLPLLHYTITPEHTQSVLAETLHFPTISSLITPATEDEMRRLFSRVEPNRTSRVIAYQLVHPSSTHGEPKE